VYNNKRSIHLAPLVYKCCAAQKIREMPSPIRFSPVSTRAVMSQVRINSR
jgi:hypothetical protein